MTLATQQLAFASAVGADIKALNGDIVAFQTALDNLDASAIKDGAEIGTARVSTFPGWSKKMETPTISNILTYLSNQVVYLAGLPITEIDDLIDPTDSNASTKTRSVAKLAVDIKTSVDEGIAALIDNAPDALNTLREIATKLTTDSSALSNLLAIVANAIRVDIAQSFTAEQKTQARANMGAASEASVISITDALGDLANFDMVAAYNAAKA